MSRYIRKTISIFPEHNSMLKTLAAHKEMPESEVIRLLIRQEFLNLMQEANG